MTAADLGTQNSYLYLDISRINLRTGDQLRIGECSIEITGQAHNGCRKFAERFRKDAVELLNSAARKEPRLRGTCTKVVEAREIRVGDVISKIERLNDHS